MFQIKVDGDVIKYTSTPWYVYHNGNGTWLKCESDKAEAISVDGELYNLSDMNYADGRPVATVIECQIEDLFREQMKGIENLETLFNHSNSVLDSSILQLDESVSERLSMIESILLDLDSMIGG